MSLRHVPEHLYRRTRTREGAHRKKSNIPRQSDKAPDMATTSEIGSGVTEKRIYQSSIWSPSIFIDFLIMNLGRPFTSSKILPRYSPTIPRHIMIQLPVIKISN